MAHITKDRIRETATTTGSGAFTLAGALTGFNAFSSVCAVNDTFYYTIAHMSLTEWEVGLGTYSAANTLTRTTIIASSNAGSAVVFSAGTKDVFITAPANKFLQIDSSGSVGSFTAGTITGALTGAASSNVLKAGDTMTGTLATNIGGGATSSTKHVQMLNGTGYDLFMLPRAGAASYNNLTQAGDAVIGYSAGSQDTGALVIGPWSASAKGIRIDSSGNVGVGTSSPGQKLEIVGDIQQQNANYLRGKNSAGTATRLFGLNAVNSLYIGSIDADHTGGTLFVKNGVEQMTLDASGRLLVGTPVAKGKISVYEASYPVIWFNNSSTGDTSSDGSFVGLSVLDLQLVNKEAGAISLWTSSTERMRIDASGNVGIGTSSPTQKLQVAGAVRVSDAATEANALQLSSTATASTIETRYNFPLLFGTNATERMRIDASGNVGIGTSSPSAKLELSVTSAGATAEVLRLSNPGAGASTQAQIKFFTTSTHYGTISAGYGASAPQMTFDLPGVSPGNYVWQITGSEKMRLDASGKVGIGLASPSGKLHVDFQGGAVIAGNATGGNNSIRLRSSGGSIGLQAAGDTSLVSSTNLWFKTGGDFSVTDVSNLGGTTRMYIDNTTGNVGINTTTPGYKLEVNGSFAATTKSFVIHHPTKEGKKLRYGSLEGPENGVYVRGRLNGNIIELPDYWVKLVDADSITVQLTPIGKFQKLSVEKIENNKVYIINDSLFSKEINCFYYVLAERNDVEKLQVEI